MRLNPLALALAFGVAKVVVTVFTILSIRIQQWIMVGPRGTMPYFGAYGYSWYTVTLVQFVMGFLGAAVGGALAAVIYNKVIARRAQAA